MNFNAMGFLIGREMAKRELGSGREDRANQLGLVGAMTPDPMMGAMMAMMMARNEGSSSTGTAQQGVFVPPPTGTNQLRTCVEIRVDRTLLKDGEIVDFGSTNAATPKTRKVAIKNISSQILELFLMPSGDRYDFSKLPNTALEPITLRPNRELEFDVDYKADVVTARDQVDTGVIRVERDFAWFELKLEGVCVGPRLVAKFDERPWTHASSPLAVVMELSTAKFLLVENDGEVELVVTIPEIQGFEFLEGTTNVAGQKLVVPAATHANGVKTRGAKTVKITKMKKSVDALFVLQTTDPECKFLLATLKNADVVPPT